MANFNQVQIIGRLGANPEIRSMPNGDLVAVLSVATSRTWTDKNTGDKKEKVYWHRVIFFRRLAEIAQQYLSKGSSVFVQGELVYRKWEDDQKVQHTIAEIRASVLQMLDSKRTNDLPVVYSDNVSDLDETIPF